MPKFTQHPWTLRRRAGLRSGTVPSVALMMGTGRLGGAAFVALASSSAALGACAANPCAACHMGRGADTDDLLFMEPQYRVRN
ncbi:MAG: hypothetical protein IKG52_07705 [Rhodobacteraceae bacterium]|nr:hypothetical protein [Paracoccaceae bacterium]